MRGGFAVKKNHLPVIGVGPIYVIVICMLTAIGVIVKLKGIISSGNIYELRIPFIIIGTILILIAPYLWFAAVFGSKLDENIKQNMLITTGVYAYVRNPIYSAFMLLCTGVIFIAGNLWLFILPIIYWGFLTVFMKVTEERWLTDLYGQEYIDYCSRVNRCIPNFRRR